MKRAVSVLLGVLVAVGCGAGEVPADGGNLSISPWHWHSIPVIEPGGTLWLGFTARNPTDQTITADSFWGGCLLTLTSPSEATQTLGGLSVLDAAGTVRDMEPGGVSTAVVDVGTLFDFDEIGPHTLRWDSPLGTLDYTLEVHIGLDYLFYRLANDVTYNEWGLYLYGEDGVFLSGSLAERVTSFGDWAIEYLVPFLDDEKECAIEGSEEATIGAMYNHRVEDYAAIMLTRILGADVPELRSMDPAERDVGIEKVKLLLEEGGY
jgi:hypothetical protein